MLFGAGRVPLLVWDEDLNLVAEKWFPEALDGITVLGDTVYVGVDRWGRGKHPLCCARIDANHADKWPRGFPTRGESAPQQRNAVRCHCLDAIANLESKVDIDGILLGEVKIQTLNAFKAIRGACGADKVRNVLP